MDVRVTMFSKKQRNPGLKISSNVTSPQVTDKKIHKKGTLHIRTPTIRLGNERSRIPVVQESNPSKRRLFPRKADIYIA